MSELTKHELVSVGQRLDSLAKLGVSARLDGDVIRFSGNTAALTPEVVAEVRANKPAFMAEIQRRADVVYEIIKYVYNKGREGIKIWSTGGDYLITNDSGKEIDEKRIREELGRLEEKSPRAFEQVVRLHWQDTGMILFDLATGEMEHACTILHQTRKRNLSNALISFIHSDAPDVFSLDDIIENNPSIREIAVVKCAVLLQKTVFDLQSKIRQLEEVIRLKSMPYQEYLKSEHWRKVRSNALLRASNKCQLCAVTTNLSVHHNTYANLGCEKDEDVLVLCWPCHSKHHDKEDKQ